MAGLVRVIDVVKKTPAPKKSVDARPKVGHDD